nr:uncharacterized protein LOC109175989 [Ipomoea trifida]GLL49625.1 uncharacterized protein LOC109175989 [Ipomoea trifida]
MSTSAVGVRDLMQEDNLVHKANSNAVLRRMNCERNTLMSYDDVSVNNSSILVIPTKKKNKAFTFDDKESSILSISFVPPSPSVVQGAARKERLAR